MSVQWRMSGLRHLESDAPDKIGKEDILQEKNEEHREVIHYQKKSTDQETLLEPK